MTTVQIIAITYLLIGCVVSSFTLRRFNVPLITLWFPVMIIIAYGKVADYLTDDTP